MSNLILRSIKDRGEKIFAQISDQIKNYRLKSLYIFTGIIIVVVASYFIWLSFFHANEVRMKEEQESPGQISQALNKGEKFLARISTGISRAFADMFSVPNENIIAEFPIEERNAREKQSVKGDAFVFIDKNSSHLGGEIIKSGSGFALGGEVIIFFSSPSGENKSVAVFANQSGQFNYTHAVQSSAETGVYHYWAEDKTTGFVTDRIKYLIVSASQKNITQAQVEEALTIVAEEGDGESSSFALPKKCSFSGAGTATDPKKVILSEIAWMGSTAHHNNEWVELKNISSSEVNISGWWLIDQAEQIKVVFPQNTIIPVGRLFILERTDDDSVPNVHADMIYAGILSNDEEGLRLLNPDCLIQDEVFADPKWPAGETSSRKTMERKADLSGWQTSVFVDGTPKQINSSGEVILPERNTATENAVAVTNVSEISGSSTTIESVGAGENQANITAPTPASTPPVPSRCSFSTAGTAMGPKQVILNEIAWMGSTEHYSNEWIELKNISPSEADISGWWLIDQEGQIRVIFPQNIRISAGGFFLLERTDDNSIPGVYADMIYRGGLSDTNEGLRLLNPDCLIQDEVFATPNWPAGERDSDKTMERKADLSGWQTSAVVNGTPRQRNSFGEVVLSENSSMATALPPESLSNQPFKILISEIRLLPTSQRFIELYNPSDSDINLTGWYIQRKTETALTFGSLVSKTHFENKIIPAKSFLVIARENISQADIILSTLTLTDSNAIQFKDASHAIVDKVGWGNASSFQGIGPAPNPSQQQSIQRRMINGVFVNTNNNIEDFELQNCPSPKNYFGNCSARGEEQIIIKYPVVTYLPRVNNFIA